MSKENEAIRALKTLKSTYSSANYSILREELDLAIKAVEEREKLKKFLKNLDNNITNLNDLSLDEAIGLYLYTKEQLEKCVKDD